ncbi:PAS domain-containing protein [Variovorax sp. RHLX14]|uniref:PAS domain-containing protein n=1 Tax=Variovorax sp. RHLX14 TaxID=1259731 RepID=UPI003F47C53B
MALAFNFDCQHMPLNFQALFDASPNPYLVLDRSLNIAGANRAYLQSVQRELSDIVGRWAWEAFPTDRETEAQAIASMRRAIATREPDVMPLLRFDIARPDTQGGGLEKRYWSISHVPVLDALGEVEFVLHHPVDVTALERLKEAPSEDTGPALRPEQARIFERAQAVHESNLALKSESDRLRNLFAQTPSFMAVLSGPEHRFELANKAYERLADARPLVGRTVRDVFDAEEATAFFDLLDQVYTTGEPFVGQGVKLQLKLTSGDTRRHLLDFVYQPMRDEKGQVTGIFVEGNDVTLLRDTMETLAQREARLRLVIENSKDHAILTTDPHGAITQWSSGAQQIFGWSEEEVLGQSVSIIFTPEDRDMGVDFQELATARAQGSALDKRWHIGKDGRRAFMNGTLNMLPLGPDGLPQGFIKIARDETDRHYAEEALVKLNATLEQRVEQRSEALQASQEQLRQSQKMEAIGQLTGGIAHDFNNMLATITSSLELMNRRIASGKGGDLTRYITLASTAAQSAAALIKRLLAFSRKQTLDLRTLDVNASIAEMENMLRRSIGENIQFELSLQPGLPNVSSDCNQLENALLNLTINARDAMPDGGLIRISTSSRELDASYVAMHPDVIAGQYVMISVSDNGTGMSPEVVAKAFDPFFTTKPIGQGTGLGLSMIYGFTRQTRGHASIHSIQGEGTTVNVYIPCNLNSLETPATQQQSVARSPKGRGETILFVEDELGVRTVLGEILGELGYDTQEAIDAPSALEVERGMARMDLLITDVGLPGTNGRQLAEMMRERRPGLKVLFITGYANKATVKGEFLGEGMDMLAKPFTIDALAHKVKGMLNRVDPEIVENRV